MGSAEFCILAVGVSDETCVAELPPQGLAAEWSASASLVGSGCADARHKRCDLIHF
jgi:hypothetical protein